MTFDFSGQSVLITGATRGIGAVLADVFEEAGAELVLTGTSTQTVDALNEHYDCRNRRYVAVDFLDENSRVLFFEDLKSLDFDVCVNNAGINRIEELVMQPRGDYYDVMNVNFHASVEVLKALVPGMKARGYGRIVNIASIWSEISKAGRGAYSASKAALVGVTRAISIELAPYNILVNCVSPGFTLTDLTKRSLSSDERDEIASSIPIQRMADPTEIATPVLFCASRSNSYMTGQNLVVDGGFVNV